MPDESGRCANCGKQMDYYEIMGFGCRNGCVSSWPDNQNSNKGDYQSEKNRKEYLRDGITEKERENMDIIDRLRWLFKGKRPQ